MEAPLILAVFGSPRREGNTSKLLQQAIAGAKDSGARVESIVLRDLRMSPCLEIYGCKKDGRCVIEDDFQGVYDQLLAADGMIIATPVFFYTASAHTKILIDRCQSLWVKKNWVAPETSNESKTFRRQGLLISVGATRGKKLFDGMLLTIKYFFDVLDMDLWRSLLYRGLDFKGDVDKHPQYFEEAYTAGRELAEEITFRKNHNPADRP